MGARLLVRVAGITDRTDGTDPDPSLMVELAVGPDGALPDDPGWETGAALPAADWSAAAAGMPGTDAYRGSAIPIEPGDFDVAFRVSADEGISWTWCDRTAPDEGEVGDYLPADATDLIVRPDDPCVPNPCMAPPPPACDPDGRTLVSHAATGACTLGRDGTASCDYPPIATDCWLTGRPCADGACKGAAVVAPAPGYAVLAEALPGAAGFAEVRNLLPVALNLTGCEVSGGGTACPVPGLFVAAARAAVPLPCAVPAGEDLALACGGLEIDRAPGPRDLPGVATALDPASHDAALNDDPAAWCPSLAARPGGGWGTPGADNPPCRGGPDHCRLEMPVLTALLPGNVLDLAGSLVIAGVTDLTPGADAHPALMAQLGGGAPGSHPATEPGWRWFDAAPDPGWDAVASGDKARDRYLVSAPMDQPQSFSAAFRVSIDGGATWTYCDRDAGPGADGSGDGYSTANAALVVVGTKCDPNPCTTPPPATCAPDGRTLRTPVAPGTCTLAGDSATCDYPAYVETDCRATGQTCEAGACAGPPAAMPKVPGDLVVTEFLARGSHTQEDRGEWIELYNPGTLPLDLKGCILTDDLFEESHEIAAHLTVWPGGYVVLAQVADPVMNYGVPFDYAWNADVILHNTGDEIVIDCAGVVIDRFGWTSNAAAPFARSLQVDSSKQDSVSNDAISNWCVGVDTYGTPLACGWGSMDCKGTPRKPNRRCTKYADVRPLLSGKCGACHTGLTPGGCTGKRCFASLHEDALAPATSCANKPTHMCIPVRIASGSMPPGAGCTGSPEADAGKPACTTADEQALLKLWSDQGAPL
ncbi:MAG: lamin tail domain-containing protein [Deltaproteobacteria bacterium]|nr:lamin tail domain-containing protein [Deltaproteobacteria bacterium]